MARLHWLLAAAAALLLALACLPRADAAVAAIDLGTEWMKVALVKPGVPMEIVLNRESKRKTATAVSIRKNERFFGDDALNLVRRAPLPGGDAVAAAHLTAVACAPSWRARGASSPASRVTRTHVCWICWATTRTTPWWPTTTAACPT